jgi:hypothetical protein
MKRPKQQNSPAAEARATKMRNLGFDRAEAYWDKVRLHCSQCLALFINNVPCHETGCPNSKWRNDDE